MAAKKAGAAKMLAEKKAHATTIAAQRREHAQKPSAKSAKERSKRAPAKKSTGRRPSHMSQHFVKLEGAPQEEQVALIHYLDNTYPHESDQFRIEVMRSIDAAPIIVWIYFGDRRVESRTSAQDFLARHPDSHHPTLEAAKEVIETLMNGYAWHGKTARLPIPAISLEFQDPESLDVEEVWEYKDRARMGESLMPVHVYYDGEAYRLFDGFHRLTALRELGVNELGAEITFGTCQDMDACYQKAFKAGLEDLRQWAATQGMNKSGRT